MLELLKIVDDEKIELIEKKMVGRTRGLYCNNTILLDSRMTSVEKRCTLGEELGHHFTTVGDIVDQTQIKNVKTEGTARKWGYERLVPLHLLAEAINYKIQNRYDLADYLNVSEEYLEKAINYYKSRYGLYCRFNEYTIFFEPLRLMKNL